MKSDTTMTSFGMCKRFEFFIFLELNSTTMETHIHVGKHIHTYTYGMSLSIYSVCSPKQKQQLCNANRFDLTWLDFSPGILGPRHVEVDKGSEGYPRVEQPMG